MKRFHTLLYMACLLTASALCAHADTEVATFQPGVTAEGAVYCLPKLAVDVVVTTTKVTYTPGELCKYADRYLRLSGISDKADEHYELTRIGLSYAPVADASKCYVIRFSSSSLAPLVQLSGDGVLLAINAENPYVEADEPAAATADAPEDVDVHAFMTEEMLMASSKAKLAELVAKEIYAIRDSRNSLLRGESDGAPTDGAGMQLVLDNMQRQEDAFLQLFSGTVRKEEARNIYRIVPTGNVQKQVVARFSRKLGAVADDNLAGSPIYIDIHNLGEAPDGVSPDAAQPRKSGKQDGVVYNLPAKASVKVYSAAVTYLEDKVPVPQFGTVETLSTKLFSPKTRTRVILDPVTGALLKVDNGQ